MSGFENNDPIDFDAGPIDFETLLEWDDVDIELTEELLERAEHDPDSVSVEEILRNVSSGAINYDVASLVVTELVADDAERAERIAVEFEPYLDHETRAVRTTALRAGVVLAEQHPTAVESLVAPLRDIVRTEDDLIYRKTALEALSHVTDSYLDEIVPVVPTVGGLLDDDAYRDYALDLLLTVSAERPEAVTDTMPELFAVLEDNLGGETLLDDEFLSVADSRIRSGDPRDRHLAGNRPREELDDLIDEMEGARFQQDIMGMEQTVEAAMILTTVADRDPETVADNIDPVIVFLKSDGPASVRALMLDLLRAVAEWRPDTHPDAELVAELGQVLETSADSLVQGRAALVLALAGDARTDSVVETVRPRLPVLIDLLDADEPEARHAAAILLSFLAERDPDPVMAAKDPLLGLLEDDQVFVRGSAIWTLKYLGGDDVLSAVETVAASDPDEEVQRLASEVAQSIEANGDASREL